VAGFDRPPRRGKNGRRSQLNPMFGGLQLSRGGAAHPRNA
jgi:hypothetical protein